MPNDAVEKPHSKHLFQLWVDFFQTKRLSLFSVFIFGFLFFLNYFHCKPA